MTAAAETAPPPGLFDLLARTWRRSAGIVSLTPNADGSAVAFADSYGGLATAFLDDPEAPGKRIRIEADTGRMTISPRRKAPIPLNEVNTGQTKPFPVAAFGKNGFLMAVADGTLHRLTARGLKIRLELPAGGPVLALAADPAHDRYAYARERTVTIFDGEAAPVARFDVTEPPCAMGFASKGAVLAVGQAGGIALRPLNSDRAERPLPIEGTPISLVWSPDDTWITCARTEGGIALVNTADGRSTVLSDYPSPVNSIVWNRAANALATSGAFRVAAWSMADPPIEDARAGALEAGRPGFVPVTALASHPKRDLIAVGYGNGLVSVAQIGTRDELLLRPDGGGAVTALNWSVDGATIAMGATDGTAALIGIPDQMFK